MKPKLNHRRKRRRSKSRERPKLPRLRLTPYAWAKLLYLRDRGPTEVGGFAVSHPEDLLLVDDVRLVEQLCTPVTVRFADTAVADYFDAQVDAGRQPEQFGRIWVHTHPGDSPLPSCTDEDTFERCFGSADWSLMLIVARGGEAYARLQLRSSPGGQFVLPVEVDFNTHFPAADTAAWEAEYLASVHEDCQRLRFLPHGRPLDDRYISPFTLAPSFDGRWSEFSDEEARWEPVDAPF